MSQERLDDIPLDPAERELQNALGSLQPAAAGVNREAMLFEAGRASVPRVARGWQFASVMLLGVALWGVLRPATVVEKKIIVRDVMPAKVAVEPAMPSAAAAAPTRIDRLFEHLPENAYLRQRSAWLANGALPPAREHAAHQDMPKPTAANENESRSIWQLRRELGGPS